MNYGLKYSESESSNNKSQLNTRISAMELLQVVLLEHLNSLEKNKETVQNILSALKKGISD